MKKLLLLFSFLGIGIIAFSQCACAGTDYASIDVNCWVPGQSATITTCQFGGEKATIFNTVAGAVYRISSCGASYDSQLSIYTTACAFVAYRDDNGPACTGTAASVDFTSPGGNLYSVFNQYNCVSNATCATISIQLISLPDYTPATSFGSNAWNVYGYLHSGYNFANQMNLTGVHYRGFYTDNNLNINSTSRWATGSSPSAASGWSGCSVPNDNHTVVYKRQGFPCGQYEIDLNGNDDGVRCYVNGTQVYQIDACCADRGIIYRGYLDANSTVEFRVSEGGGGSDLNVAFNNVGGINATASVTPKTTCNLYDITVNTDNPTYAYCSWLNTNFGAALANTQLNGVAAYTGGGCRLTPNSGSQLGSFTVDNPSGFNATDVHVNFDFYIGNGSGADGMSISYGNIPMSSNNGETGSGSELIIRMITYSGAGPRVDLVYNNTVLASYSGFPWRGAQRACSVRIVNGQLTYVIDGTTVFNNVSLGASYVAATKTSWKWAFAARTGGATDDHYIYNLQIAAKDYEYSIGAGWQSSPIFSNVVGGSSYTVQARPKCSSACPTTIRTIALPNMNPTLSATAVSPTCAGGSNGSIDLSVSGSLQGARVVKIVQLANEPFNVNEIQAFQVGGGTNMALASNGGGADQSSSPYSPSYVASLLNDGILNDAVGAHTNTGVGQWQKVYWEEPVTLDRIVIWNRVNCCDYRLNNIRIEVYGDFAETNLLFSQNVNANNGLGASYTFSPVNPFSNATNTYAWSNSASTEDISGLAAGLYDVTVTTDYGCVATLTGIEVDSPATHTLTSVITNEVCPADNNGAINLIVSSPRTKAEPPAFSGLTIWTKADAGVVKNKEGHVIQWQDLSGNDNHFFTSFGDNVQEVSGAIGGQKAIRFDADNIMETANVLSGNFTIIVVGKLNGGTNARLVSSGTNNWLLGWWGGRREQFYSEGWVHNPGTTATLTTPYIYSSTGNTATDAYSFWQNGTLLAANNGGSAAPGSISLGGWGTGNTELSNGDVAEVIAYNRVLTTNERLALEKYLADKYGILGLTGVDPTYSWSPGGATTEDISSLDAGTYSVSITDAANCVTTRNYDVGVDKTLSVNPTDATVSSSFICTGSSVTLNVVGGSLGSGASWEWYTDAAFSTNIGNGSSISPTPSSTTTYYVRGEGDCNTTTAQSELVVVNGSAVSPGASVNLASSTSSSTCVVNDNNWHYFYNSSGELLAAINSNNQNLGNVSIEITVGDAGPFGEGLPPGVCGTPDASGGEYVLPRYWDIQVDNQPSSPVDVIYYYSNADLNSLYTTINSQSSNYIECWGDINGESDLMMSVNHTDGGIQTFPTLSPTAGPASGQRKIQFQLAEFSGGKLHSNGGIQGANPLPVELASFTASAKDDFILVAWSTLTEINNEGFDLLRSTDGIHFEKIHWANGHGNTTEFHSYIFKDEDVASNVTYYYQLKQVDFDGQFEYFDIVAAKIEADRLAVIGNLIPNPSKENTSVQANIVSIANEAIQITVLNHFGSKIAQYEAEIIEGSNDVNIAINNLASGTYFINFDGSFGRVTRKLVIVK